MNKLFSNLSTFALKFAASVIFPGSLFLIAWGTSATSTASGENPKLIFAIDIVRHGDRLPLIDLPLAPFPLSQGQTFASGLLTPKGTEQLHKLGQRARADYLKNQLLPEHYDPSRIYARSTDIERTRLSGRSFLNGLYPKQGPKIPLDVIALQEDSLLLVRPSKNPVDLFRKSQKEAEIQKRILDPHRPQLETWSKLTGLKLDSIDSFIQFSDHISIRKTHGIEMPKGISAEESDLIIQLGDELFLQKMSIPETIASSSKELFRTIQNYLSQKVKHNSPLSYVFYAAHDSTLMSALSAFKISVDRSPEVASLLSISLWSRRSLLGNDDKEDYFVKVSLNRQDFFIPVCQSIECPLEKLLEI